MVIIEIVGHGCEKCQAIAENLAEAAELLGIEYDLQEVTDLNEMSDRGVTALPALIINDDVVLNGIVPDEMELMTLLTHACAVEA